MDPKTIAFHHFGCKVNFAEASYLSRQFREKGYTIIDFHEKADVYVISTCVVTAVAEKKCRAAIRQAHKTNPGARIAVIGCFSELKPTEIAKIEGVNVILGHTGKFNLLDEIEKKPYPGTSGPNAYKTYTDTDFVPSYSYGDRTRSFLKIQDGCDYFCAYCTIPLARGHSRSDTTGNIIKNAKKLVAAGVKEIVLTGVNIGDFGRKNNETFFDLLTELDKIEIPRIRLSSIEPDLLSDDIIELMSHSRHFMPHFHIPLQSGSDKTLKTMKRKYLAEHYQSRIQKIRSLLPNACIASDVIVGFPGETDNEFSATFKFIENLDISYLHVFTYSSRDNTLAARMQDVVAEKIKKERSDLLHKLSDRKKKEFYMRNMGLEASVLFESDDSNGYMHGFTENYIKVKTQYDPGYSNRIFTVKLEHLDSDLTYLLRNEE